MELRAPAALEEYNMYQMNNLNVYIHKRIKTMNSGLKFHLRKVFFIKNIVVDGVRPAGF